MHCNSCCADLESKQLLRLPFAAACCRQVRYRASWGWPNFLDVQAAGWDEAAFERWVVDGQMHLTANVRMLN